MPAETDLGKLLRSLKPERHPGQYVFCTLGSQELPANLDPVMSLHESEGLTVILPRAQADELGLPYTLVCAWITLTVHSALDAVGLTAAVATALAQSGISCNLAAGYYHDHLFVPVQDAGQALSILHRLSQQAG